MKLPIFMVTIVFAHVPLVWTFLTTILPINPVMERAESCDFFDTDSGCSSFVDDSGLTGVSLSPEVVSDVGLDSFDVPGQLLWTDDMSTLPLETEPLTDNSFLASPELLAAGNLDLGFGQNQMDGLDSFLDDNSILGGQTTDPSSELIAESGQDDGLTMICPENGEVCQIYHDKMRTPDRLFAKCDEQNRNCQLCDETGTTCTQLKGFDKESIPSPDNPYGQSWNRCPNQQCLGCTSLTRIAAQVKDDGCNGN